METDKNLTKTSIDREVQQNSYFDFRGVSSRTDNHFPRYLKTLLPENKSDRILDIGCGYGDLLISLQAHGFGNVEGVDLSRQSVEHLLKFDIPVHQSDVIDFIKSFDSRKYKFIIMSHVLEHLDKTDIIEVLQGIREKLLDVGGELFVRVPNAQAHTGCYWAYEDFTHTTLFTAGSLIYVLKSAGFGTIEFVDSYNLEGLSYSKKLVRKILLGVYHWNRVFWNKVTACSYHKPSPEIYSWELKCVASPRVPL